MKYVVDVVHFDNLLEEMKSLVYVLKCIEERLENIERGLENHNEGGKQ